MRDRKNFRSVQNVHIWFKHSCMSLVDGIVDKSLLCTSTRVHQSQTALQIVQIFDLCLVKYVLHNAADLVVDRIKVWAIWLFAPRLASVRLCELYSLH